MSSSCAIYGNVLFTPVCLSMYAGPSVQYLHTCSWWLKTVKSCWLISWHWLGWVSRFVNSTTFVSVSVFCFRPVASSFAQNSSACLLRCRFSHVLSSKRQRWATKTEVDRRRKNEGRFPKSRTRPTRKNKRGRRRRSCIGTAKAIQGGSVGGSRGMRGEERLDGCSACGCCRQ